MSASDLLISAEDLHSRIGEDALRILDCRFDLSDPGSGKRQYLDGHIPAAVYADLDKDLAAPAGPQTGRHPLPDPEIFAATLGRLGIGNDTSVVVYDQAGGGIAARAWWLLRWAGHDAVRLLDGGFARWCALGYAQQQGSVAVDKQQFELQLRQQRVLTTREVLAAGPDCADLQLVDARDAARFRGEIEPIDAVAGHVPGALNLPFSANLRDDGTWQEVEVLEALWRDLLGAGNGKPWAVMCGSGVTACHHVISALLAGLPEPRLYVGSWSEWIQDPARPVAGP